MADRRRLDRVHRLRRRAPGERDARDRGLLPRETLATWWAVGLAGHGDAAIAITMIGTRGRARPTACASSSSTWAAARDGHHRRHAVRFLHGGGSSRLTSSGAALPDAKTRSSTAFLLLLSRGTSVARIISAPHRFIGHLREYGGCVALIGVPTVLYTMIGGVQR